MNLKYNYDMDIERFYKKKNKIPGVIDTLKYDHSDKIVFTNKSFLPDTFKLHDSNNTGQKKVQKTKKSSFFLKNLNIYYGILFVFIFCFLFFLSVSLSYASPKKNLTDEHDFIYKNSNSLSLIKESIKLDENNIEQDNVKPVILEKISFVNYIVKKNDTLSTISKKFGLTEDTVILTNYLKTRLIKNGVSITIPNQNGRLITVGKNDSVYKISVQYGVSWEKIADVNNLKNEKLENGTKLFIPGSKLTSYEKEKYYEGKAFIWPIKGVTTSFFGLRIDPFTLTYSYHTGLDIRNSYGTPVKSVNDGVVYHTGFDAVYGNFITIKHSNGIISKYGHLSKISVKPGEKIQRGQVIGNVGSTGRSTGAHLHFEIYKNGKLINPQKIYN